MPLYVTKIDEGSRAHKLGLSLGCALLAVDGHPLNSNFGGLTHLRRGAPSARNGDDGKSDFRRRSSLISRASPPAEPPVRRTGEVVPEPCQAGSVVT